MKATKELPFSKTHNLKVQGVLVEKDISKAKKTPKVKQPTTRDLLLGLVKQVNNIDKRLGNVESDIKTLNKRVSKLEG